MKLKVNVIDVESDVLYTYSSIRTFVKELFDYYLRYKINFKIVLSDKNWTLKSRKANKKLEKKLSKQKQKELKIAQTNEEVTDEDYLLS